MELRVVGCHGGETPKHRTSAFVLDNRYTIDAGSLTSGLTVPEQAKLKACFISHAHLDHVRDLATIADNRCQLACEPLQIVGTKGTLRTLKKHFFNNQLWPDFSQIPSGDSPTIEYVELVPERPKLVAGRTVTAVMVDHTIESAALIIDDGKKAIAYSGDTGPTDRLWEVLAEMPNVSALLMEVSFPNREKGLAQASGHHTPRSMAVDLKKLKRGQDLPTILFHIKPVFQREVERECARIKGLSLEVAKLEDRYLF